MKDKIESLSKVSNAVSKLKWKHFMGFKPYLVLIIITLVGNVYIDITDRITDKKLYFILFNSIVFLSLLIIILINLGIIIGNKKSINMYILLSGDDDSHDEMVFEITRNIIEKMRKKCIPDTIKIKVPNYCARKNWSNFIKKRDVKNFEKSLVYKILTKIWKADIIVFGEITTKRGSNKIQILNSVLLLDCFKRIFSKNIEWRITIDDCNELYCFLENKYEDFLDVSKIYTYISTYYIGILYGLNRQFDLALEYHMPLLKESASVKRNLPNIHDLSVCELFHVLDIKKESREYVSAISLIDKFIFYSGDKNYLVTKCQYIMMSSTSKIEFDKNYKRCILELKSVVLQDNGILSKAYLMICKKDYSEALRIYKNYFRQTSLRSIEYYEGIKSYCIEAQQKEFEFEIATFCLAVLHYYCNCYNDALQYCNLITDLKMIRELQQIEGDLKEKTKL